MMQTIYTGLLYDDSINVKGLQDDKIFTQAGFNPEEITIKELLWCGAQIANSRTMVEGADLMEKIISIASYHVNKKGILDGNK